MSITEVAKAAGVSTATVSRVLNELPGVRDKTIQQVRTVVEAMNYKPRRSSRGRAAVGGMGSNGKGTGNIAAITLGQTRDWLQFPVMASVVAGIQRAAGEFGLRLLLDDLPDPSKPSRLVQGRQIDGAVVFLTSRIPVRSYEPILQALRERIPVVWAMGMELNVAEVDHVAPDNVSTGYIAHAYLYSRHCKTIGYLTENPEWAFMRLRGQAFLNAAYDAGNAATAYLLTADSMLAESYGRNVVTAASLEKLIATMARAKNRPDGLFISNDATTAQAYPLLFKYKFLPGRDVTVISCDNEEIRLSTLQPRPATIDIGAEEIGFHAVVRLCSRMRRPADAPLVIQVAPRLVEPGGNASQETQAVK